MKRTLKMLSGFSIVLLCFSVLQVSAKSSLKMPNQKISVQKKNGKAVFKDQSLHGEPGQPNLPRNTLTFLLPAQADMNNISVVMENVQEKELDGNFEVEAALPPTTAGKAFWPKNRNIENGKDVDVYRRNAFFPANHVIKVTPGKMRQYKVVQVSVAPVRYNPVTGKLKMITGGQLSVYTKNDPATKNMRPAANSSQSFIKKLQSITVNFDEAASSYGITSSSQKSLSPAQAPLTGETYAIITTSAIVSQSTQLQNFIDSKTSRGFNVQLIDETVWGGGIGDAAADNLRSWLQANYLSRNISYVLLIGNPNPSNGDVPMKMAWPNNNSTEHRECPTDFYFAELTGDWDVDNDGFFGESDDDVEALGGPDMFSEISLGRIPFYGIISDLDHILAKIIAYENERSDTFDWRTNTLIPSEPLDPNTPGYHFAEAIIKDILIPQGWGKFRIYEKNYGVNPEMTPCSEASTYLCWVKGTYGTVNWSTHGGPESAADIMTSNIALKLNDNYPSIVFQGSCDNAFPEHSRNLSYTLLKNGAIAALGSTRASWYAGEQSHFVNTPTDFGMSYAFSENVVKKGMFVGDALGDLRATIDMSGWWMNCIDFNVYGDPAVGVYTSPDNFLLVSDIPDQKIFNGESFKTIDLDNHVFNSKYGDDQVSWSVSGNASLDVSISNNVATITPVSSGWTGKETIVFTATNPEGVSKSDTAVFEIAGTQMVYLSDLSWTSATCGYGTIQLDRSIDRNPITVGGITYEKGIGTHAQSEIVYQLNGMYDLFSCVVGIDDEADGAVQFKVYGDTSILFTSRVLNYGESVKCEVSVQGFSQLRLVAEEGQSNYSDHADWADAKLVSGITTPSKTIEVRVTPHSVQGCTEPAWDPNKIYNTDSICSHNGHLWRAQWWSQNQEPGTTGQYGVWVNLGECPDQQTFYYGMVSPSGLVRVDYTGNVTINSLPDSGYVMTDLSIDGQSVSPEYWNNGYYIFTNVTDNHVLHATFDQEVYNWLYVSTIYVLNGNAIGTSNYVLNKPVPIVALPEPGYRFTGWSVEFGNCTIADPLSPVTTVTLHGESSVFANYEEDNSLSHLTASPTTLDFGAVQVNTSVPQTIMLTNDGNSDAVVTSISSSSPMFTVSQDLPLTIPSGSSATITVVFRPTATGNVNGTLTVINTIDAVQEQEISVSLSGEGSGPHDWNLAVTPTIFSTGAQLSFTANPLFVNSSATFKLYQIYRSGAPRTLVEEFSTTIAAGTNTFTRPVWDYLPSGYYQLDMSNGTGDVLLDQYSIEKLNNPIDFQLSVTPQLVAREVTLTFNNPSPYIVGDTASLLFLNSSQSFTQTAVIDSGINSIVQNVGSQYYPLGEYTVIMSINSQQVDTVTFTKVAQDYTLQASVSSLDFGSVSVGSNASATVILTNTGNTPALISAMNTSNPVFTVTPATPITVQPGSSTTVTVKFTPLSAGTETGTFTIINAPDAQIQTITITLAGTGENQTSNFEVTMVPDNNATGNSIQPSITLKNIGTSNIDMSKVVIEYYTYDPSIYIGDLRADIYYCSMSNCSASVNKLAQTYGSGNQKADTKNAFSFSSGTLAPNGVVQLQPGIYTVNWQYNFDERDDWSHVVGPSNKAQFIIVRDKTTNAIVYGTVPTGM